VISVQWIAVDAITSLCMRKSKERKRPVKPVAEFIDEFFASRVEVVDDGISQRRTAFEVIYLQLCNKAMAGNRRALKVLKQYSDFAASQAPAGGYSRTVWLDDDEYLEYLRGAK
jgi:hypothetical protein